MREQFEQLPEIKRRIHHLVFNEKLNIYQLERKTSGFSPRI